MSLRPATRIGASRNAHNLPLTNRRPAGTGSAPPVSAPSQGSFLGSDSISMKFTDGNRAVLQKGISAMPINFRISALVPEGLIVESVAQLDHSILVTARAGIQVASCPLCGSPSRRVHSRYAREVSDLPCSGRSVRLRIMMRRYRCDTRHCRRRIFAERFDKTVLLVRSRRTSRPDCIVHHLGLALGGRPAASFAKRLMLPVSNDTVLRVVRARACPRTEPLNVVGIDDWPSDVTTAMEQSSVTWSDGAS